MGHISMLTEIKTLKADRNCRGRINEAEVGGKTGGTSYAACCHEPAYNEPNVYTLTLVLCLFVYGFVV
jgi:hypothetical protein